MEGQCPRGGAGDGDQAGVVVETMETIIMTVVLVVFLLLLEIILVAITVRRVEVIETQILSPMRPL